MKLDGRFLKLHIGGGDHWFRVLGYGVHVTDERRIEPMMRNLFSMSGKRRWLGRFVVKGLWP